MAEQSLSFQQLLLNDGPLLGFLGFFGLMLLRKITIKISPDVSIVVTADYLERLLNLHVMLFLRGEQVQTWKMLRSCHSEKEGMRGKI
jgi:hypothetical protein